MSYKKLKNFQEIFNREDFSYISNENNIKNIESWVLSIPTMDDSEVNELTRKLKYYLRSLESFYFWTKNTIPEIQEGIMKSRKELLRITELIKEPYERRSLIRWGSLKKFLKTFLHGLNKLLIGIRVMFDSDLVGNTTITNEQLSNYILDDKEGLGRKYEFNTQGNNAFVPILNSLDRKELIATEKLLERAPKNQVRVVHKWKDFGISRYPVRILIEPRRGRKDRVYFLFKVTTGHRAYEDLVRIPPEKLKFSAF